ncbi:MAG: hypothetical protein VR68_13855 [Peptococcaceae bacterium BRH_c4a]|nr:MAG: hypothetical protein VR68_13855 [Peptococcaceae bacterium BRH_c4a]
MFYFELGKKTHKSYKPMTALFSRISVPLVNNILHRQVKFMSVDNVDKSVNNLIEGVYICG